MKEKLSEAEAADMILSALLDSEKEYLTIEEIKKDVFNDDLHYDMVLHVVKVMNQKASQFFKIEFGKNVDYIEKNGLTDSLKSNGGFSKIFENEESQKNLDEERENLERELAKSNLEANKLNKKIAKRNIKNQKINRITTWINVVIGLINIGLLVWQILKDD